MGLEPRRRTPSILALNVSPLRIGSGMVILKYEANVGRLRNVDVGVAESSPNLSEVPRIASTGEGTLKGATDGKAKAW